MEQKQSHSAQFISHHRENPTESPAGFFCCFFLSGESPSVLTLEAETQKIQVALLTNTHAVFSLVQYICTNNYYNKNTGKSEMRAGINKLCMWDQKNPEADVKKIAPAAESKEEKWRMDVLITSNVTNEENSA